MYEESVSHCPINVTWFPFDEQHCYLIFESWKYNNSQLNISSAVMMHNVHHFHESEQWHLIGTYNGRELGLGQRDMVPIKIRNCGLNAPKREETRYHRILTFILVLLLLLYTSSVVCE